MEIPPPPNSINNSRNKSKLKNYGVVAIVLVVALAGSLITFSLLAPQAKEAQQLRDSLFVGAYASYYGETTVIGQKLGLQLRLEIADMNSTHIKTLSYIKLDGNTAGKVYEQQFTNWTAKNEGGMDFKVYGMIFLSKKDDSVYFPTLGTRDCTIVEYQYKAGTGIDGSMTVYLEPTTGWPYKIVLQLKH